MHFLFLPFSSSRTLKMHSLWGRTLKTHSLQGRMTPIFQRPPTCFLYWWYLFSDDDHHSRRVGGSHFRLLYCTARFAFLCFFTHFSMHFFISSSTFLHSFFFSFGFVFLFFEWCFILRFIFGFSKLYFYFFATDVVYKQGLWIQIMMLYVYL